MKRFILPGFLTLCTVLPAMAADWPSNNYMQASTTYNSAATSTHMGVSSGSTTADAYYKIDAGYFLPANLYEAAVCPAGRYCSGAAAVKKSSSAQGNSGAVTKGYWASGGAKTATPTSNSDCVGSSPSCGKCVDGFSTASTGATSYTQCTKAASTASCAAIFPVDTTYPYKTVVYNSNAFINLTNVTQTGGSAITGLACTISQTSATGQGSCVVDDVRSCFVRGATCDTADYTLNTKPLGKGQSDSAIQQWIGDGSSSKDGNNVALYPSVTTAGLGYFLVPFGGGTTEVRGIYMQVSDCSSTSGYNSCTYSASGAYCACQIQTIKRSGRTYPVTSEWEMISKNNQTCGQACTGMFSKLGDLGTKFTLYPYKCSPNVNTVVLSGNGGAGTIANKTVTASGSPIAATCSANQVIGTSFPWNSNAGSQTTTLTKGTANNASSAKVFIGYGETASSTTPTTKTCTEANLIDGNGDGIVYYAIWASPSCNAHSDGSATNVAFSSVTGNTVYCTGKNAAGYYCTSDNLKGTKSVASVTVQCAKCPTNWSSAAGSATANTHCTRSITLDKNGATAGSAYSGLATSQTCNYNTNCTLPDVTAGKLTKPGYTSTGWGTTTSCTSTSNVIKSTDQAATVKAYVCWTANSITITWTGVKTVPSGFSAISNSTATSNVSYGGNIVTPTAAVAATAGQTFLGWKFSSAQ